MRRTTIARGLLTGLGVAFVALAAGSVGSEESVPATAPAALEPGEPVDGEAVPGAEAGELPPSDDGPVVDARAATRVPLTMPLELEIEAPAPGEQIRLLVPLAEVRGRAGRAAFFAADVVVAIDASTSSLLASGMDVDGDGATGRSRGWADETGRFPKPPRSWTTDPDDTVFAAQLLVARLLIHGLGARDDRIGVLTFTSRARMRAPVGQPAAASAALDGLQATRDREGTDVARALRTANELLQAASGGADRPREVLLFSVEEPSVPDGEHWAAQRALDQARELQEQGVRVWTVGFGSRAKREFLAELADAGGGSLIPLEQLGPLVDEPVLPSLRPQKLRIDNLTIGQPARAVRSFRDGRFDGFVPLAEGENTLEVEVVLSDGVRTTDRIRVVYEHPGEETEADRREAARLLVELRRRSTEIEGGE